MDDQSRHAATSLDTDFTLTIDETVERYSRAGLPRTPRSVQRYCPKDLISTASVDKHIAYIQEIADATGRDTPRPGATVVVPPSAPIEAPTPEPTRHDEPRQVANSNAESRYVARLESEVDFLRGQVSTKDAQIKELTERSRETNVLIGGLQRMLSPLLGLPDPHRSISDNTHDNTSP
jgi:hypothetical protein